jgi:PAS domain S-box-containing protein
MDLPDAQPDIEDRKMAEATLAGEKRLLEMVAGGHSLSGILEALCQLVEGAASGRYCSVVLVDPSGARLERGAAPSLPASFIDSIIDGPLNADSGPCAMSARLNEQVIAADLASETRWPAYGWGPMALAHGLQACWSTPISSAAGKVLGAFAIYYDKPRTPRPLEHGLIDRFTHIARIAIERAQSDAALKQSEARKAAILESALDCIVTIDHEGSITEFNPAAERTFGYRRDEVVGKALADVIIPQALRERHRQGFARYLATGEARVIGRRLELTAVRADGSEFPVELAITRVPMDGPPSFTGYLRDITERKRSEETLRRSKDYLEHAQKLSHTGSVGFRLADGQLFWSEEAAHIYGYDPAIPPTMEMILQRVHPDDAGPLTQVFGRAAAQAGMSFDFEHRLLMPDGSIKHVRNFAHSVKDESGHEEILGAIMDITERKRAEVELRRSEADLRRAQAELAHVTRVTTMGELAASIAHEVNQPIAGVVINGNACLRWLAGEKEESANLAEAREALQRIIRDGNRAGEIIARIRALFKKTELAKGPLDLNETVREVIVLVRNEMDKQKVVLRLELASALPDVLGDRVQLQQVMLNLILNAIEAMAAVEGRARELVIQTQPCEEGKVLVTIRDSGIGLDAVSMERVFTAFHTTKPAGLGMGLSISRSIVANHAGRLWVTAHDGPGASFHFTLRTTSGAEPWLSGGD